MTDEGADPSVQCASCGRDAVPRAWVTGRGNLYCETCFDMDTCTAERIANINTTSRETVVFAKMLMGGVTT